MSSPPTQRISLKARLAMVPGKVRERGASWLLQRGVEIVQRRLHRIVYRAQLGITALLVGMLRLIVWLLRKSWPFAGTSATRLCAIYDLNTYPISFDICWFLVWCDLERQRRRLQTVQCIIVPIADQDKRKFPEGYDAVVDRHSRDWRLDNILLPMIELLPNGGGVTVCGNAQEAEWFRILAQHSHPPNHASLPPLSTIYRETIDGLVASGARWGLRAHVQGLRYIDRWLARHGAGRRPVVMTLRQYEVDPARNTRLDDWAAFAQELLARGYYPIVVPDTDKALDPLPQFAGLATFEPACWNIGLRMALYQRAYLNLFVNTGPGSLCMLNSECRYLFFKISVPDTHLASGELLRAMGFEPGTTPRFATPMQKWVWEDDTIDVLRREFDAMAAHIDRIEAREASYAAAQR